MRLLQIIAIGLLYIAGTATTASAALAIDDEKSFLGRTFILTFDLGGKRKDFRFIVTKAGKIYSFRNNSGDCANTGAATFIDSVATTKYECGDFSETIHFSSKLSGNTLTLIMDSPGELVHTISKFSFSSFGGKCRANSYSISIKYSPKLEGFKPSNSSYDPVGCTATMGR